MNIQLNDVGKKYNRQWIFRHLDAEIKTGSVTAITGHNGSGKSTLIQIISSFITPSEGSVTFGDDHRDVQTKFAFVGPYQNLIEEFTLTEHLAFHAKFKKPKMTNAAILEQSGLLGNDHKLVKEFSSGMRQRLRLALAFFYTSDIVFLDEPTSNLDQSGVDWYHQLVSSHATDKTIVIASNQPYEYEMATEKIFIENYKR